MAVTLAACRRGEIWCAGAGVDLYGASAKDIQATLPALEAAIHLIRAPMAELAVAGLHISQVIGPAASVP
jgi:hypothetical protein